MKKTGKDDIIDGYFAGVWIVCTQLRRITADPHD